jgi:hypothetical protein
LAFFLPAQGRRPAHSFRSAQWPLQPAPTPSPSSLALPTGAHVSAASTSPLAWFWLDVRLPGWDWSARLAPLYSKSSHLPCLPLNPRVVYPSAWAATPETLAKAIYKLVLESPWIHRPCKLDAEFLVEIAKPRSPFLLIFCLVLIVLPRRPCRAFTAAGSSRATTTTFLGSGFLL